MAPSVPFVTRHLLEMMASVSTLGKALKMLTFLTFGN
jgi:hypothetical protein